MANRNGLSDRRTEEGDLDSVDEERHIREVNRHVLLAEGKPADRRVPVGLKIRMAATDALRTDATDLDRPRGAGQSDHIEEVVHGEDPLRR
jgi:hypothetical protein